MNIRMQSNWVKICGLTRVQDAAQAVDAGADLLGLNFYPDSPRYVSAETAGEIAQHVAASDSSDSSAVRIAGVFVNATAQQILDIAQVVGRELLSVVQLHGNESPDELSSMRSHWAQADWQPSVWKAIAAQVAKQEQDADRVERVAAKIASWQRAGVDRVLLDAAAPGVFGGTGQVIDWHQVRRWQDQLGLGFVLAGGLNPDNVAQAIQQSGVHAVDVASGVELSPGVKDAEQMRQFVRAARQAWDAMECGQTPD